MQVNDRNQDENDRMPRELRLSIPGPHGHDRMYALHQWLTNEDALRGRLELRTKPVQPGDMGGTLDMLAVAITSLGVGATLARSLSTWLLHTHSDIVITIRTPDGRRVTVDVHRARDPESIVREVQTLVHHATGDTTESNNTITAKTVGIAVQADAIHGDIHIHPPVTPPTGLATPQATDAEEIP